jgi:hypothetical protein
MCTDLTCAHYKSVRPIRNGQIADGRAEIENGGTPEASLVIGTRHFPRGSTIRHEDVED